MADKDYVELDPKGYWADAARNIRRMSGEQEVVLTATEECSALEWSLFCQTLEALRPLSD